MLQAWVIVLYHMIYNSKTTRSGPKLCFCFQADCISVQYFSYTVISWSSTWWMPIIGARSWYIYLQEGKLCLGSILWIVFPSLPWVPYPLQEQCSAPRLVFDSLHTELSSLGMSCCSVSPLLIINCTTWTLMLALLHCMALRRSRCSRTELVLHCFPKCLHVAKSIKHCSDGCGEGWHNFNHMCIDGYFNHTTQRWYVHKYD